MLRPLHELADEELRRFHAVVLEPSFPPAELMSYEELRAALRDSESQGLGLFEGPHPVAGVVTEEYVGGAVLLVGYLAVVPTARSGGLGSFLLEGALAGRDPAPLVLAEIEDPRYHGLLGTSDPAARLRFYRRFGSRLLPLPYVQPALRPGSPRVDHLLLIALRPPGSRVDRALVAEFLDEYYTACEGEEVCRTDATYRGLRARVLDDTASGLSLHDLDELEAAWPSP